MFRATAHDHAVRLQYFDQRDLLSSQALLLHRQKATVAARSLWSSKGIKPLLCCAGIAKAERSSPARRERPRPSAWSPSLSPGRWAHLPPAVPRIGRRTRCTSCAHSMPRRTRGVSCKPFCASSRRVDEAMRSCHLGMRLLFSVLTVHSHSRRTIPTLSTISLQCAGLQPHFGRVVLVCVHTRHCCGSTLWS